LRTLQARVVACCRCPRLVAWRERVAREKRARYREAPYWGKPLPSFGDPAARVLIVGLAPAAHGGNRTGRMFTGDGSADWLARALHRAGFATQPTSRHRDDGFRLTDAYLTAAVRCAPPANKPTREEFANCHPYLVRELQLLPRLRVVVALGRLAFDACLAACPALGIAVPRPRPAFAHGIVHRLGPLTLIASYHPSQQNTQTGRLTAAMLQRVFRAARRLAGPRADSQATRPGVEYAAARGDDGR
jgi:uracil-DNA glycosylase family 4